MNSNTQRHADDGHRHTVRHNAGPTSGLRADVHCYTPILRCPVCGSSMTARQQSAVVCAQQHNFDRAKNGYFNMVLHRADSAYTTGMMKARRAIYQTGFFQSVIAYIADLLQNQTTAQTSTPFFVADAGCGEGSLLSSVLAGGSSPGIGFDLSKDGIRMAASLAPSMLWCVADLARLPLQDASVGTLLNVLAPAGYAEFARVLRDDGLFVKVIPGEAYLRELRSLLYPAQKHRYCGDRVRALFTRHFAETASQRIRTKIAVDADSAEHLLRMTPLSWQADISSALPQVSQLREITADLVVLVGRKKVGNAE